MFGVVVCQCLHLSHRPVQTLPGERAVCLVLSCVSVYIYLTVPFRPGQVKEPCVLVLSCVSVYIYLTVPFRPGQVKEPCFHRPVQTLPGERAVCFGVVYQWRGRRAGGVGALSLAAGGATHQHLGTHGQTELAARASGPHP